MASSLLAKSQPATSQPDGVPEIDWSNPITQGLLACFLPHVPRNLVDDVALSTSGSFARGASGFGVSVSGGAIGYPAVSSSSAPEAKLDQQVFSALAVCQQTAGENADWYALFRGAGSSYPPWGVGLHSGSLNGPAICYGSYRGLSGAGPVVDLGAGWTLKPRVVLLLANAGAWACWSEGFKAGSGTTTAPSFQYTSSGGDRRVMLAAMNGTGASLKIRPGLGLYWGRVLTDEEAASITSNPWQIFRDEAVLPISVSGAGAITLAIQEAFHTQPIDAVALVTLSNLAIADSSHAQAIDQVTVTGQGTLSVNDSSHGHLVDSLVLGALTSLSVNGADHSHVIDNLLLIAGLSLATADGTHGHAADAVSLTGQSYLSINESLHGHQVDSADLFGTPTLTILDGAHTHVSDSLLLSILGAGMTVESADYIGQLDSLRPGSSDFKYEGDDHIRLLKSALKTTFNGLTNNTPVTVSEADLNSIPSLAPKASPALTGTPTAPTATLGTSTTQLATTQFVQSAVASAVGGTGGLVLSISNSASIALVKGQHDASIYTAGLVTWTLPASPAAGDTVAATPCNDRTDNVIARNGQNIMGLAEDMTLDNASVTVTLRFINSTVGWRMI